MEELEQALSESNRGKSMVPDDITNEELRLPDDDNKAALLSHANHCLSTSSTQKGWTHAHVISIFEGCGDPSHLTRYRLNSLLNT